MPLSPGRRLGAYEVLSAIGQGGMGEVYRGRDVRLGRDVALKVLPEAFAADPERLARFEREARTLASLNHPNIAQLYGVEDSGDVHALVMELVPGPTLADRIAAGTPSVQEGAAGSAASGHPMDLPEIVAIARQIAGALEAAHAAGIMHRDLKPANIKVRDDGTVKVLDFGLAKAMDAGRNDVQSTGQSASRPTITSPAMTAQGVILGTAAYMAPEQARGRVVDERADIWSFGAVLYEMLTGARAFAGADVLETLSSVIGKEPDWRAIPATTPARLRELVERCLTRDTSQRLQAIGEARIALERAAADPTPVAPAEGRPGEPARVWLRLLPWAIAAALAVLAALSWRPSPVAPAAPLRLTAELGANASINPQGEPSLAFSQDGSFLVFRASTRSDGPQQVFIRRLDQLTALPIAGTEGAFGLFLSPDGHTLAFFADDKLKRVPITGGAAVSICDVSNARGGAWTDDGHIIFAGGSRAGLSRVSAGGGTPEALTTLDTAAGEITHRFPDVLPGGRGVMYTAHTNSENFDDASVYVQPLDGGERSLVLKGGYLARYLPSGHLAFVRGGTLLVVPFDLASLKTTGNPVPIVEGISANVGSAFAQYAFSTNGTLAYLPAVGVFDPIGVAWLDASGRLEPIRPAGNYRSLRLSPDGRQVALELRENSRSDIWLYEWDRGIMTRMTPSPASEERPAWTPDGRRVVYSSDTGSPGEPHLFWKRVDGAGSEERLTNGRHSERPVAGSWHPDGQRMAYVELDENYRTALDILLVALQGNDTAGWTPGTPSQLLNEPHDESDPAFSPDGRWLAYRSTESGRAEVYVRRFPELDGKQQVSTAGGRLPTWSRAGDVLFYEDPENRIMTVRLEQTSVGLRPSRPAPWADVRLAVGAGVSRNFDVHPDGTRLVVFHGHAAPAVAPSGGLVIVFNVFDELRRMAPTSR